MKMHMDHHDSTCFKLEPLLHAIMLTSWKLICKTIRRQQQQGLKMWMSCLDVILNDLTSGELHELSKS